MESFQHFKVLIGPYLHEVKSLLPDLRIPRLGQHPLIITVGNVLFQPLLLLELQQLLPLLSLLWLLHPVEVPLFNTLLKHQLPISIFHSTAVYLLRLLLQHIPLFRQRHTQQVRSDFRVLHSGDSSEGRLGQPIDPLNKVTVELFQANEGTGEHLFVKLVLPWRTVAERLLVLDV